MATAATTEEMSIIKEKFRKGIYEWCDLPSVLEVSNGIVLVSRDAPHPKLVEPLGTSSPRGTIPADKVKSEKIRVTSGGDWEFDVFSVDCGYFDSREDCDEFFCPSELRENTRKNEPTKKVSLENAFPVSITANLDYYLSSNLIDEFEQDLGKPVDREKLLRNDTAYLEILNQQLFYKLACQLFGEDEEHEDEEVSCGDRECKKFMIGEYRILSVDGNAFQSTARRGSHYLLFFYSTS